MNYNIEEISQAVEGNFLNRIVDFDIRYVHIDSRTIINSVNSVFVAISGPNNDGHNYIEDVYDSGVRNFLIDNSDKFEKLKSEIRTEANFIKVNNSLDALQTLTLYHRMKFDIPILGITGSNGKTIVKEWLYQLLYKDKNIHRSPKSYNSQVGVPLSLFGLNGNHELGIFEAGISTTAEMEKLASIINPTIGIITNIGPAHQEGFTSEKQKVVEKLKLFRNSGTLIYCKDHNAIHDEILNGKGELFSKDILFYTWSLKTDADLEVRDVIKNKKSTVVSCILRGREFEVKIPFIDDASVENAIHCILLLFVLGYEPDFFMDKLPELSPVEMRLELKQGINNCTIINDAYNSDLNSLSIALDYLCQQRQNDNKTVILSDILQSGINEEELYSEVADIIHGREIDRIIGVGKNICSFQQLFNIEKDFFPDTSEFLKKIDSLNFNDEAILIKGARLFSFEKITSSLQNKVHNTILELNLQSLVHNLNVYRSHLNPGTRVMAMVKAFSYGSGSYEIANILQFHQVDFLAVAYPDEGVELRKAGITLPVMVMNPDKESFPVMLSTDLQPEIYSIRLLKSLVSYLKNDRKNKKISVHIKLDTGMSRLGFSPEEIDELVKILKENQFITVKSVFSHLASADNKDHDDFTQEQVELFDKLSSHIIKELDNRILRHLANSAACVRFPELHYDMVRLGIGLYGFDSAGMINEKLENVSTLKTYISQIKGVKKGKNVGYSLSGKLTKDAEIATIGIGYADGFPRSLGNGKGSVLINGKRAFTVGNICMDMTMIDVSGLNAREGDEVIIFGEGFTIQERAEESGTIPYEVLTNVSGRVKRIYFKE